MSTMLVPLAQPVLAASRGLPLHPLIVHAATVLLPLSLLGLVLAVAVPRLRPRLAGLSLLLLVAGVGAAWLAEETGETLADQVGVARDHARYGAWVPAVAVLALIVAAAWWRLQRTPPAPEAPAWRLRAAGAAVVVMAVVTVGVTFLTGHSGAASVWKSKGQAAAATTPGSAGGTTTGGAATGGTTTGGAATGGGGGRTLADVAKHNTRGDCWSVVEGKVYDLTPWISEHPGGAGSIAGMCGVDATAAFRGQHAAAQSPSAALARFLLGPLSAGGPAAPAATAPTAVPAPTTRYSSAEVARHASATDCWSVVDGKVYDLTKWVSRHPGGQGAIAEMCGGNGAGEYLEQHAGDAAAGQVLAGYQVGVLG